MEFSDFECGYCGRAAAVIPRLLREYEGKIHFIFKHSPLPFHSAAQLAHEAALAAADQNKFWPMHDLLFANQSKLSKAELLSYARQIGLEMQPFEEALEKRRYQSTVSRDLAEARALGVTGTPTFFINGKKVVGAKDYAAFKALLDAELGIRADRKPLEFNLRTAPTRGPTSAAANLVVFSDFECPYCSQLVPTLDALSKQFPTELRIAFKHFPLSFHRDARGAHQAAVAAAEQGQFWQMHDKLFLNRHALKPEHLRGYAANLGLDAKKFEASLTSAETQRLIDSDISEGAAAGVAGTPTLFLNGRIIDARNQQEIAQLIQAEIRGNLNPKSFVEAQPPSLRKGPESAPIKIEWFSDLQSPLTPQAAELIDLTLRAYPGQIQVTFRNLPLESRKESKITHQAAMLAAERGKFWEFHSLLLENGKPLTADAFPQIGEKLGIDGLAKPPESPHIHADMANALERNVRGTPTFFVNGKRIDGLQPFAVIRSFIEAELRAK